ncbi:MAG: phosphoribosylanthranilate isomerase [Oscillospiraceae bacterium]|nr:phosphoribosylanthranilate isomerase [Oscillospiraceae bacterium]
MKIKICGVFNPCDIDYVNEALPDYVGFVFAESRRQINNQTAREFKKKLDPRIKSVGVFVNADISDIKYLYGAGVIDVAQLHGEENFEYIKKLKGIPVIKTILPGGDCNSVINADYFLFDSGAGSGKTFDWSGIPKVPKPFFLAGGINLDNIHEAVKVNSYCIDLSGGAETDGVKNREKITEIVKICRGELCSPAQEEAL